jgi:TRAP-type uncharacterized transport system substrate-binding protein
VNSCKTFLVLTQLLEKAKVVLTMSKNFKRISIGLATLLALHGHTVAQPRGGRTEVQTLRPPAQSSEPSVKEKLNAWTIGLAGGLLEGAPIRFATDIARVVDDGDNLHVLPIVTRGPAENVEALLYLKGIDAAVINSDALEEFKTLVPDIRQKITYIMSLFLSELHVFVRPEIRSIQDLAGKKVNFNTPGTSAAYSGPLIFERLKIDVEKTFIPHQLALEQLKSGEMAAVVFVTSKPVDAFARGRWEPGFKFVPLEYNSSFEDHYLPSTLGSNDYPQLIQQGSQVNTIAVPSILAAFNWPRNSDRYRRVARLVNYLFDRIERLHESGYHPKWKEVNLGATVPGLNRSPAAQEWLDRVAGDSSGNNPTQSNTQIDTTLIRAEARRVAPHSRAEQQRLFQEFMNWQRERRRGNPMLP